MNYFVIDAFASKPFSGNPAAVVPLGSPLPDPVLQAIANEFSLAETAFPRRLEDGRFELRWFTPVCEVLLCGQLSRRRLTLKDKWFVATQCLWPGRYAVKAPRSQITIGQPIVRQAMDI